MHLSGLQGSDALQNEIVRGLTSRPDRRQAALVARNEMRRASAAGDYALAGRLAFALRRHCGDHPRMGVVYGGLFGSLFQAGRFDEAARLAGELVEELPHRSRSRTTLLLQGAYALGMAGEDVRAMTATDGITRESTDERTRWSASSTRALILRSTGDDAGAERLFEEVEDSAPWYEGRDHALFHRAMLMASRGAGAEAEVELQRMRAVRSVYSFYGLAFVYAIRADWGRASRAIDEEVRAGGYAPQEMQKALLVAALLDMVAGETGAAEPQLRRLMRRCAPGSRTAPVTGFYLGHRDRITFDRALRRFPVSGQPVTRTLFQCLEGVRLERAGDAEEAGRYYREATRGDPSRFWPSVVAERRLAGHGR